MEGSRARDRHGDDGPRRPAGGHDGRAPVVPGGTRGRCSRSRTRRPGVAGAHPAPRRRPALAGLDLWHSRCGDEQAPPGPVDPHAPSPHRHRRRGSRAVHRSPRSRSRTPMVVPRARCSGLSRTWPRCSPCSACTACTSATASVSATPLSTMAPVFHAVLIGTLGMWAYLKLVPAERPVLGQAALFFALNVTAVLAARSSVRNLTRRALPPERVLIVGGGDGAQLLLRKIRSCSYLRLHPLASSTTRAWHALPGGPRAPRHHRQCGRPPGERRRAGDHGVHRPRRAAHDGPGSRGQPRTREGQRAALLVDALGPSTEVDDLEGVTVLGLNPVRFSRSTWP